MQESCPKVVAFTKTYYATFYLRCGQETRVVPRMLQMRQHWMKSAKESVRLLEAGVSPEVMKILTVS